MTYEKEEIQTREILNNIIHLEEYKEHEYTRDDFHQVRRRKREYKVENGAADQVFHGYGRQKKDEKIWMFVTKVPDDVTSDNIIKYVNQHTQSKTTYAKQIETKNTRPNNQSFMVGVEPHLKQRVYEPNFGPTNVLFDRFNFKIGQHFLDRPVYKQPSMENKGIPRPGSFL